LTQWSLYVRDMCYWWSVYLFGCGSVCRCVQYVATHSSSSGMKNKRHGTWRTPSASVGRY